MFNVSFTTISIIIKTIKKAEVSFEWLKQFIVIGQYLLGAYLQNDDQIDCTLKNE